MTESEKNGCPRGSKLGKIAAVKDEVSNFQSAVNGAVVDHVSVLCLEPEVEAVTRRREVLKLDFRVFFQDFKYFNLIAFLLKISSLSIKEESGPLELYLGRRYDIEPAMLLNCNDKFNYVTHSFSPSDI